jgi:dipeptidyl aminopeptidase/acylaminoacyl peptidase
MAKRPIQPDDLLRLVLVGDPQISPSEDRILFSHKTVGEKNKTVSGLACVDFEGKIHFWTGSGSSASQGRWSPNGHWISFISSRTGDIGQIYLISTSGGEAEKLTDFPEGSIGKVVWSPDSSKIALTFRATAQEATKEAASKRTENGLSSPPMVFDDLKFRLDGDGYFGNQRYELWVIDVKKALACKGDLGQCTVCRYSEDAHGNYDFDWSPDSKELAVIHSLSGHPFIDPPNDQIWRLICDGSDQTGQANMLPGLPKGEKSAPAWSPDGKSIAYAGNVDEDDPWGVRNTKIYLTSAEGGDFTDLTGSEDIDCAVSTLSDTKEATFGASLFWAPDNMGLYVQIGRLGESQLGYVPLDGGVKLLTEGHHSISLGNISPSGKKIAAVYGTATKLGEIAVLERELATGAWFPHVLTGCNLAFHDEVETIEPRELWIPTTDGLRLHGWILKPAHLPGGTRTAAVLQVHGGPHAQYGWTFFHELQCQAAAGYVVVYTNPRGSTGYGEAWTSAIQRDWGNKDWEDVQAATSWMQQEPSIDASRIAIMCGSYGGYMTNWAIGHSDAYRCAITDRCVSNLVSMAGNSDFPFNKNGYFRGIAYGDLEDIKYLWEQSPIAYFKNVKTPTLVIHSAGDLRCNIEQGEQVFTALQQEKVESRMVRYPESTSHGMSRSGPPDLRIHRLHEILSWLGRYLG